MDYETIYVPDAEFNEFVRSRPWELISIDGSARWLVEIDGVKKIVRPESSKFPVPWWRKIIRKYL